MNERSGGKGKIWVPFAGLALLALLVGAFAVSCGGTVAEQPAEPQASADLDHPTLGAEDAPVVLTEYADYQ
jgi:hypothetical protein